jgi:predicted ATPase/class 3 adenylate cyclase
VTCAACGRECRGDARFCDGCGAPLERSCAGCGRALRPEARFCDGCGRPLEAEPEAAAAAEERDPRAYTPPHLAQRILGSRSAIEGERKHVTVLFADVAGSTPLAEAIDPEEMHALMDRAFQRILPEVHRWEGTINQFTGDGVMALFGAPIALEDAPARAVRAALGIQRALAPLNDDVRARHGADFRWRIGIHSGPVVVGTIGDDLRMDYTAVGDTTNLADRLQKLCPPGGVLVSEASEHAISGLFEVEDLGALGVRGRAEPVHAFRIVSERAERDRLDAETELTPLVGRERELDALLAAFDSAEQGHGQVVFLVGDAGIGKSRLLREFRERLGARAPVWVEGRCASWARNTPFHPIADGLRRVAGIEERDDDDAALARLDRAQQTFGRDLDWTLPFVRMLLSLPAGDEAASAMDPVTRRSQTFRALHARTLRSAERDPLVVVVEDLHWVDAASEEFLGFLADSIPAARVLLVFTHRPGYKHSFGDRSYHVRVALQSLSEEQMAEMAGSVLRARELPDPLRRLIASKAEGNPFFVEEVVRSLLEEGALRRSDGHVELARPLDDISVPDRIQDVLAARIDRLGEEPKRAIQVASVIGREFALRLLERVRESGDRVTGAVDELRALELIYEKAVHPELAFMFKHALTHEVAYESILLQRRRALHLLVGSAIEELYADRLAEHYEALAGHFAIAGDREKTFRYHALAARKSAGAFANESAAEHCRRALELAEELDAPLEERLKLEKLLAEVCFCLSDFRAAGEAYVRAAELSSDPERRSAHLGRGAYGFLWGHEFERAHEVVAEALALARSSGSAKAEAIATATAYELAMCEGRTEEKPLAQRAVLLARSSGDVEATVRALSMETQQAEWEGRFRDAIAVGEEALALARRERLATLAIYPQWFLGLSRCGLGQYGRAIETLEKVMELCNRIGDRAMRARALNSLGWCYAEAGCPERAQEFNRQAEALGREMVELDLVAGAPELHANAAINLAGNLVTLGDPDGALAHLDPIRARLEKPGDPWMRWRYSLHVAHGIARVTLANGDPESALALLDEELGGARRHGAPKIETRSQELRGRALVAMDRRKEARGALESALEIAERIEYPPPIWRALSLLAELARRDGEGARAQELGARAQRLVAGVAPGVPTELRGGLAALGERLVVDPLAACR